MFPTTDPIPFFLHEATLSLFLADANGEPAGPPIWCGALANRLRARLELTGPRVRGSGERYHTQHHTAEEHTLEIDRSWILRKTSLGDFQPGRGTQYVLLLVWYSNGYWHSRTYYGVTAQTVNWDSQSTNQFLHGQVWKAQRYVPAGGGSALPSSVIASTGQTGSGNSGSGGTPLPGTVVIPAPATEQPIGFFREDVLVVGEYLLGHYRWGIPVYLGAARCITWAPQETTVLTLEINGGLTATTLTLPPGTANTEITVDLAVNTLVPALSAVRWKITSGPGAEAAAWHLALTLLASPQ